MPPTNPWKSYRQIATQTAPPGQLVLMLFDGAIRSLDRALLGFNSTDVGERNATIHNNLTRAVDIIRELNHSLDMEAGGQLADTLRNLYAFFEHRLLDCNMKKSRQGIDEVVPMLKQLRDAWFNMLSGQTAEVRRAPQRRLVGQPIDRRMNAESELLHAYREWHRLARAETKAIQTRNWDLLSDCHLAIKDFQTHIAGLTQAARTEWQRAGCNALEKEQNLKVFAAELVELTQSNQNLLQATLKTARQQLDHLGEAGRNLKLLQRSYGLVPAWSRAR